MHQLIMRRLAQAAMLTALASCYPKYLPPPEPLRPHTAIPRADIPNLGCFLRGLRIQDVPFDLERGALENSPITFVRPIGGRIRIFVNGIHNASLNVSPRSRFHAITHDEREGLVIIPQVAMGNARLSFIFVTTPKDRSCIGWVSKQYDISSIVEEEGGLFDPLLIGRDLATGILFTARTRDGVPWENTYLLRFTDGLPGFQVIERSRMDACQCYLDWYFNGIDAREATKSTAFNLAFAQHQEAVQCSPSATE